MVQFPLLFELSGFFDDGERFGEEVGVGGRAGGTTSRQSSFGTPDAKLLQAENQGLDRVPNPGRRGAGHGRHGQINFADRNRGCGNWAN